MASFNGASGAGQVPDNVVWDENNPPTVHTCTYSDADHATDCDGSCGEIVLKEIDVKLHNEKLEWARMQMNPIMIPIGFDMFGVAGMPADLLDTEAKLHGMIDCLIAAGVITEEGMDLAYKERKFEKLNKTRLLSEDAIKRARTEQTLGIRPGGGGLLGPDGQQLT